MDSLEPTPFRLLVDRVVPLLRPHFLAALPATAAPLALAGVVLVTLQYRMMSSAMSGAADPSAAALLGSIGGFFLALLFMIVAYVLTYSALGVAAMEVVHGDGRFRLGSAWRRILRPRLLGTIILWTGAGFVSLMLCAAPALIVVPLLALTLNVVVAEERYGLDALKRSAALVWWTPTGRPIDSTFLRVAALIFIGWGVQSGISMVVQAPLAGVQQYHVLRDAAGGVASDPAAIAGPLWVQVVAQIFGGLAAAVAWLYWSFGFAMLYGELRRQREATDLRRAILELTEPGSSEEPGPATDDDLPAVPSPA